MYVYKCYDVCMFVCLCMCFDLLVFVYFAVFGRVYLCVCDCVFV